MKASGHAHRPVFLLAAAAAWLALALPAGMAAAATREIVERVAADMPERSDEDRLETARRCLLAAASA